MCVTVVMFTPTLGAGVASRELGFHQLFLGHDWLFKMNDVGLNLSVLNILPQE